MMLKRFLTQCQTAAKISVLISTFRPAKRQGGAPYKNQKLFQKASGLALILVVFIVALASILVVNLAYSSYIAGVINLSAERSVQAEYLLKSAVSLAQVLIKNDQTPDIDSFKDDWAFFINGSQIPGALLSINQPNVMISLELRPEDTKFPIAPLAQTTAAGGQTLVLWRDAFANLFETLGFDSDGEQIVSGPLQGKFYNSKQMVANLIDYMDPDDKPYNPGNFPAGYEGITPGVRSLNKPITTVSQLSNVPGFTAARIQMLLPFITTTANLSKLNINLAPPLLIKNLHQKIEDQEVTNIVSFRDSENGPLQAGQIKNFVSDSDAQQACDLVTSVRSNVFQVTAKVNYLTSVFFLKATLRRAGTTAASGMPEVVALELY
ncbi:MAG TPA: type II secretion system protein GspK [Oligoflexia bacterium]|nr:type II secretion system protein GspK [Oligoflexia bacterium]HMP27251.1 type II secretion system protein GspK [Oligoflexia bacterium]